MFDWARLAPTRCYLCGGEGADTREHVVSKTFYERKRLPDDAVVLPAHDACNKSTSLDEQTVSIAWAACAPEGWTSTERYERAKRGLLRPEAHGMREDFLKRLQPLGQGQGARLEVPLVSIQYVLAKFVRGLLYRETGHVIGPRTLWFVTAVPFDFMVETEGDLIDVHGVVLARWQDTHPWDRDNGVWCLNALGFPYAIITFTDEPEMTSRVDAMAKSVALPWPRVRPTRTAP